MTATSFKIVPEPTEPGKPSRLIPKACFTTDDTTELSHRFYESEDGRITAGVWECAPCKLEIPGYPVDEKMTIISGQLVITNEAGVEETFGPGEVVFAPKGSKFTWHITEHLKKYFMTFSSGH